MLHDSSHNIRFTLNEYSLTHCSQRLACAGEKGIKGGYLNGENRIVDVLPVFKKTGVGAGN